MVKKSEKKLSGLEKAIIAISLFSIILGICIGYPAITGNVVAENSENFMLTGAALFVLGLLGIFLSTRK